MSKAERKLVIPDSSVGGRGQSQEENPIAKLFRSLTGMNPDLGLYFHHPVNYPTGKPTGWKLFKWFSSEDAAWAFLLDIAGDKRYTNFRGVDSLKYPQGIAYKDIARKDRDNMWYSELAIVVAITDTGIAAIYRHHCTLEEGKSPYCLIYIGDCPLSEIG